MTASPRVFISYTHDSHEHSTNVLKMSNRLRGDGVISQIDQYVENPSEGWPMWMHKRMEEADFVLVVSTKRYAEKAQDSKRSGGRFESVMVLQDLYDAGMTNDRFVPVVFDSHDAQHILKWIRQFKYYNVSNDDGYDALLRRLLNDPAIVPPPIGTPVKQGPKVQTKGEVLISNNPSASLCPSSPQPKVQLPMDTCEVVFFASNPTGTGQLALDKQLREIESKVRSAEHRDNLKLISKWAVRPDDLLQALNQHDARLVHFSGHGSTSEEIILTNEQGEAKPVSKDALIALFGTLGENVRLVILNACYSRRQADAITEHVDCAIGMNKAIGDRAAITFAASVYRAIGFGKSVQEAFDQGIAALLLEGIPEENTPELISKHGVDPEDLYLLKPEKPAARDND